VAYPGHDDHTWRAQEAGYLIRSRAEGEESQGQSGSFGELGFLAIQPELISIKGGVQGDHDNDVSILFVTLYELSELTHHRKIRCSLTDKFLRTL